MGALMLFGGMFLVMALAVAALLSTIFGAAIWLVLLPLRLAWFAVKLVLAAVFGVVGLGLMVAVGMVAGVVLLLTIMAPLMPLLLIVAVIWWLFRSRRQVVRV